MRDYEIKRKLYNGKKNALWGAGKNGIQVLLAFAAQGIQVDLICDADGKKQGIKVFNKEIVAPEKILEDHTEYNFIVTPGGKEALEEIAGVLDRSGIKDYLVWKDICNMVSLTVLDLSDSTRISLYHIIQDSYLRKLVIYGTEREGAVFANLLGMLGVEIAYFVDDGIKTVYTQWGREIRSVYDLLDEKEGTYKVIVMSEKRKKTYILDKMGLKCGIDYDWHDKYTMSIKRRFILDANLGYSFMSARKEDKMPGIVETGDGGFVIALLGGSTTDGGQFPFKSWGEILYGKLSQNGYRVKILNCGCGGYTTSQELIKLIRDIIPLKPDVVIDYTGANDSDYLDVEYSFVTGYQKHLIQYMAENIKYSDARIGNIIIEGNAKYTDKYILGVNHNNQCFQVFADNIKMMNSICRGYGIEYQAFLQPWMGTKQNKISRYEYEFILNCGWDSRPEALRFCEHAWPLVSEYAENMTSLFDNEPDVYIDYVHVNEHGNEIIAQYMYDYLTERGIVKK